MKERYYPMPESNRSLEKISRREFNKLAAAILGGIGLGGATYSGIKVLEGLGLRFGPPEPLNNNFFWEESRRLARSTEAAPTATPFRPESTQEAPTPESTPTPETESLWQFAGIDFSDSTKNVDMGFFIGSDTILVPAFIPFSYYNGALEDGTFTPEANTGLTYLDPNNRKVLNLHSGRRGALDTEGFTVWGLQKYLEEYPEKGIRRRPNEVDALLLNSVVGSDVVMRQGDTSSMVKVAAAVRVPPEMVAESQKHVYDITDWLKSNYPDFGFAGLGNDRDILVIKFCGRILTGEKEDSSRSTYQQSRFFIALRKS